MKRMTRKLYGILILSMLATQVHGGWLSNLGQRIVNGAANTVQNNISGKVNKTIDDVMNGKIQTNKGKKGNSNVSNNNSAIPISDENSSTGIPNGSVPQSSTYRGERGKALRVTGKYEEIDVGIFRFRAESISIFV